MASTYLVRKLKHTRFEKQPTCSHAPLSKLPFAFLLCLFLISYTCISTNDNMSEEINDRDEGGQQFRCRFYANKYPELEEVVMVNVTEIGDMGAYVTLLEYDNIEVRPSTNRDYILEI